MSETIYHKIVIEPLSSGNRSGYQATWKERSRLNGVWSTNPCDTPFAVVTVDLVDDHYVLRTAHMDVEEAARESGTSRLYSKLRLLGVEHVQEAANLRAHKKLRNILDRTERSRVSATIEDLAIPTPA